MKEKGDDNFLELFDRISQMFVKLNYQGTRVRMPHLILALLTGKTRREKGESFRNKMILLSKELEDIKWEIRESVIIRVYTAIATNMSGFRQARNLLEKMGANIALNYLERARSVLTYTCKEILSKELNIKGTKFLKSEYILVPLSYYVHKKDLNITPSDIESIKQWLILASFNKRYTGRLESDLKEDIELLHKGEGFKDLVEKLSIRSIIEEWFDRPYEREHLLVLMILLKNSYDMIKGTVQISSLNLEDLQVHHIFPKDLLKKVYKDKIDDMDLETAYDHVANITIISKRANSSIGNKRPDEYLGHLDNKIIASHYIPLNKNLWKPENYLEFLEQRKNMIISALKESMPKK